MKSELNSAAPSLQKAINIRRNQKQDAHLEMESRAISQEAAGDGQTGASRVDSTNQNTTLSESTSKDVEKAEKVLDVSRSGQSVTESIQEKEDQKQKEVEANQEALIAAANQEINSSWSDVGGTA